MVAGRLEKGGRRFTNRGIVINDNDYPASRLWCNWNLIGQGCRLPRTSDSVCRVGPAPVPMFRNLASSAAVALQGKLRAQCCWPGRTRSLIGWQSRTLGKRETSPVAIASKLKLPKLLCSRPDRKRFGGVTIAQNHPRATSTVKSNVSPLRRNQLQDCASSASARHQFRVWPHGHEALCREVR